MRRLTWIMIVAIPVCPVKADWEVIGVGSSSGGITPSPALDGTGAPHIAHVSADGGSLFYSLDDGYAWNDDPTAVADTAASALPLAMTLSPIPSPAA